MRFAIRRRRRQFAQYTFASIAAYLAAVNGSAPKGYTNFQQVVGNPSISTTRCSRNFFAQDTWKPLRNLTVTYGVRYDVYKTPDGGPDCAVRLLEELPHRQE